MAVRSKKKNKPGSAARKGWGSPRAEAMRAAAARAQAKEAAARKRAERKRAKNAAHKKKVAAGQKGAARHLLKARLAHSLGVFVLAVDSRPPATASPAAAARYRETLKLVKRSYRKAKAQFEAAYEGSRERMLEILESLADEAGTAWDIAYAAGESE